MVPDKPQAQGRLAVLFRSAGTRWALPASAVLEVAPAPAAGEPRRNGLVVEDFATLFGAPPAQGEGCVTLVLDCAPPRALRIEAVEEIVDVAGAPFFRLPQGLAPRELVRGALRHRDRLVLELELQALAALRGPFAPAATAPLPAADAGPGERPGRSLVFEAGELGLLGLPLSVVTGVLRAEAPCVVPNAPPGHRGLIHHERTILSLWDLASLAGKRPTAGDLAVAADASGQAVAVLSSRVVGVLDGFGGEPRPEPGAVRWRAGDGRRVLFPDLERWIFPRA